MASPTYVNFGPFLLRRMVYRTRIFDLWYSTLRRDGLEIPCLVRRMLPPYTQGPDYIRMLRDRCLEVQGFQHPGTLRPLGFDLLDGIPYVVLELTRGWNLQELLGSFLEGGRVVPPEVALQLLFPVAHALATGHSRPGAPLAHGALRPSSIWVGVDGAARVADLEIGVLAEYELANVEVFEAWRYQAPERSARWAGPSPVVDVFSIGAILLELMVAGRLNELQRKMGTQDRLRFLPNVGVPPAVLQLIAACMAEEPRRPAMATVVDALRQVGGQLPRTPVAAWLASYAPPIEPLAQAAGGERLLSQQVAAIASGFHELPDAERTTMAPDRPSSPPVEAPAQAPRPASPRRRVVSIAAAILLLGVTGWAFRDPIRAMLPGQAPERAVVSIESSPPGAQIEQDGEVLGEAPLRKVVRVDPDGRVTLLARKEGWMTQGPVRLEVPGDGALSYRFVLEPRVEGLAAARITTEPTGAKVSVDGKARGEAPVTVGELHSAEEHSVTATLAGHTPATRTFRVEVGRIEEVNLVLTPGEAAPKATRPAVQAERPGGGFLVLEASAPAQILIDGQPRGRTGSGRKISLTPGSHSIELFDPVRNLSGTYEVMVVAGESQLLEYDFASGQWRARAVQPAGDSAASRSPGDGETGQAGEGAPPAGEAAP